MLKITILMDNKVIDHRPFKLKAEWGFSALIETKDGVILFDAGQTAATFANFLALDLPWPQQIVLSHGHFDHTGGLEPFLNLKTTKTLLCHPDSFLPRTYQGAYIGLPFSKELIQSYVQIIEHCDPVEVLPNVWATGQIERKHPSCLVQGATIFKDGQLLPDNIADDQALAIKTSKGGVVILGCCHSGLKNTLIKAEKILKQKINFILGGTHLIAMQPEEIKKMFAEIELKMIAPCHCTGLEREFLLKNILQNKCQLIGSGSVITI